MSDRVEWMGYGRHHGLHDYTENTMYANAFGISPPNHISYEMLNAVTWAAFTGLPQAQHENTTGQWLQQNFFPNGEFNNPSWPRTHDLAVPNQPLSMATDDPSPFTSEQQISVQSSSAASPEPSLLQPPAPEPIKKRMTTTAQPRVSKRTESKPKPTPNPKTKTKKKPKESPKGHEDHEDSEEAAHKRLQDRNRIAANKFRSRKRGDAARLQREEEELEQRNMTLNSCAKELMAEAHRLKMDLLKHSSCECTMIQQYIRNEAQRYVQGIEQSPDGNGGEPHALRGGLYRSSIDMASQASGPDQHHSNGDGSTGPSPFGAGSQ